MLLKDYGDKLYRGLDSENDTDLDETSPFIKVTDKSGKEMVVRKSSVCWLLSQDKFKLSSDRLQRVQEKEYAKKQGNISV